MRLTRETRVKEHVRACPSAECSYILLTPEIAAIWTQLALAYAIHKSFIFIRVPLTAAVTPKVVKVLRSWGWDIGKRRPKPPKTVK